MVINGAADFFHQRQRDEQRDTLMLTLVEKIRSTIDDHTLLAQTGPSDFALLMKRAHNPFRAMRLARNLMLRINQPVKQGFDTDHHQPPRLLAVAMTDVLIKQRQKQRAVGPAAPLMTIRCWHRPDRATLRY
jgi:GGDEF domain-containing protein